MPTINRGQKKQRERTENKRIYQSIYQDRRWKRLRKLKFSTNPLCEICLEENHITQTEEIHHVIPFQTGITEDQIEALAFDFDNLQSLCIKHHKIVDNKIRIGRFK